MGDGQKQTKHRASKGARGVRTFAPTPLRERMFEIVERARPGDGVSRAYDVFIVAVAIISIVPLMFTPQTMSPERAAFVTTLDVACAYVLAFDYLMRWMTHDIRRGERGVGAFIRYPFTPMAIVDLLSILPSLGVLPANFMFLRALRVVRIFRYWRGLSIIARVFAAESRTLLSVLAIALVYIFVSALMMFVNEPQIFGSFFDALYWATTALTTVGYGDITPTTDAGKVVSMVSSLFGVAVIALPAGIVTGGFLEQMRLEQGSKAENAPAPTRGAIVMQGEGSKGQARRTHGGRTADDAVFSWTSVRVVNAAKERLVSLLRRAGGAGHAEAAGASDAQGREKAPRRSVRVWLHEGLRSHPRIEVYGLVMLACFGLNIACYEIAAALGLPLWLDTTGTALAAVLLEPAAALIVGFANNLVIAIQLGSAGDLLYYSLSALVALTYGILLGPGRKREPRLALITLAVVGIGGGLFAIGLAWLVSASQITASEDRFYYAVLSAVGLPQGYAVFWALLIGKILDSIAVFVIVSALARGVHKSPLGSLLRSVRKMPRKGRKERWAAGRADEGRSSIALAAGEGVRPIERTGAALGHAQGDAALRGVTDGPSSRSLPTSEGTSRSHPPVRRAAGVLAPGGRAASVKRRRPRGNRHG